jgi:ATP-binding cassette subfamily B protein
LNSREIAFQNVSFGYEPGQTTLADATFAISQGSRVAFIGASGSGKSTVLNLIMRFYDPRQGTVAFDGQNIRQVTQESLRLRMGVVFQESFLFNTSIREIIRMGRPSASDADGPACHQRLLAREIEQIENHIFTS